MTVRPAPCLIEFAGAEANPVFEFEVLVARFLSEQQSLAIELLSLGATVFETVVLGFSCPWIMVFQHPLVYSPLKR